MNTRKTDKNGDYVNRTFEGSIDLGYDLFQYKNYNVTSNIAVTLDNPAIGGSAEIRMIGDGTHTPLFAAFTKSSGSSDYDPTLNAINKVVFYYDGTETFYSITVL